MKKLKNVMVTWVIVYLLITGLIYLLNQWLVMQPVYVRTLILSGLMVFAMQYLIFPGLRKLKNHFK